MAKRSSITLTLPTLTDPVDVEVLNKAFRQIETAINELVVECNNSMKYVSAGSNYIEIQKDE